MKYNRLLILSLFVFIIPFSCFASTKTYERTVENPLVPKDVLVGNNNIQRILLTPAVSSEEKIYDFGEVLNESEEIELYRRINEFIDYSDIDVCVVTTNDLRGFSIDQYADNFYDYNDFKNDGVIFVIYLGGSEPNIYMGNNGDSKGKVFSIYSEVRVKETLKYLYKDIKAGKYYKAISDYVKILEGFFNIDRGGNYRLNENGKIVKNIPWFEITILASSLTFLIIMFLIYRLNNKKKLVSNDLNYYVDNDTVMIKTEKDELIDTSQVKE